MNQNRGFTLVEVLVVLVLVGLILSTAVFVLWHSLETGLWGVVQAEKTKDLAQTVWFLQNQLEGIYQKFALRHQGSQILMGFLTTCGEKYPGIVQVRYRVEGGRVYYCESPYPHGELFSCPEGDEHLLLEVSDFEVEAYDNSWQTNFSGVPQKVRLLINGLPVVAQVGTRLSLR